MRAKCAAAAGLIAVLAWMLTACGGQAASSVKEAVSSIAASRSAAATQSAPAAPTTTQAASAQGTPAQTATSAGGGAVVPSLSQPTSAQASSTPAGSGSSSGFAWGWFWLAVGIALAAIIGAAVAVWARKRRQRSSAAVNWQARVIDAYAAGAALHDAMAAAETPGALGADDAALRWSDIQHRADDYSELLYGMELAAPGDQERLVLNGVISSLQAARSAMDAERSAGRADGSLSLTVRDRLAYFASALSQLRQPDVRPAP